MRGGTPKIERELFIQLWTAGASQSTIGAYFGLSRVAMWKRAKLLGLPDLSTARHRVAMQIINDHAARNAGVAS